MKLINELHIISFLFLNQFKLIFLYWLAGVVAGSIVSVFASRKIAGLASSMDKRRFYVVGAVFAALLGAASPLCMYGTVPLIASFGKRGIPQHILSAFMISSILINPNLLIFSFALGTPMALLRLLVCIMAGILAGVLTSTFFKSKKLFNFEGFENENNRIDKLPGVGAFLGSVNRGIMRTAPYFLAGILLTALFERYFPKSLIVMMFGSNMGLGVLMASTLGVPVYVCGGGTIPLLRTWMDMGMSPGSSLAFMVSGPATKLTNLSAVKIILGIRNFIFYIAFNMIFSVVVGLTTDIVYRYVL